MNFDDGDSHTHFCSTHLRKKAVIQNRILSSKKLENGEVIFRSKSRSKTQTVMFLAGEASYKPKNHMLGNEF